MFWIICDPSSGSMELYLTEIIHSGSQMFVMCLVRVWQHNFEPVVCVCVYLFIYLFIYLQHVPLQRNTTCSGFLLGTVVHYLYLLDLYRYHCYHYVLLWSLAVFGSL